MCAKEFDSNTAMKKHIQQEHCSLKHISTQRMRHIPIKQQSQQNLPEATGSN